MNINGHCFGCGVGELDPLKVYNGAVDTSFYIFCSKECYERWLRREEERLYALKHCVDDVELESMCKTFADTWNSTDGRRILDAWEDMPEDTRDEVRRAMRVTVDFILSHWR
jgi:hypothetical protein